MAHLQGPVWVCNAEFCSSQCPVSAPQQGQESQSPQHCSTHLRIPAALPGYSQRCVTHQEPTASAWEDSRTHRMWQMRVQTLPLGATNKFSAISVKPWNQEFHRDRIQMSAQSLGVLVRNAQRTSRCKVFMGFTFMGFTFFLLAPPSHGMSLLVTQHSPQNPLLWSRNPPDFTFTI